MRKLMVSLGMLLCLSSGALFYLIFFKLAPYITSLIPAGSWESILRLIVYVVLGYFGGIGIPVTFIILGIFLILNK